MSSFTALMQLSAQQTAAQTQAVSSVLAEREKALEARRRAQEAREKKEREEQATLRLKRFELERKAAEIERKREQEKLRLEKELERREEQIRDSLLGKVKGHHSTRDRHRSRSTSPMAGSSSSRTLGKRARDRDDSPDPATQLTREEKRARREALQFQRASGQSSSKRHSRFGSSGSVNGVRRLPGGAIDSQTPMDASTEAGIGISVANSGGQSVKARLAAMPPTLTKLNIHKRDLRTIDEIVADNAKKRETKILEGEQAREFSDWFGKSKKDKEKAKSTATSAAPTPAPHSHSGSPAPSLGSMKKKPAVPVGADARIAGPSKMGAKASSNAGHKGSSIGGSSRHLSNLSSPASPPPSYASRPRPGAASAPANSTRHRPRSSPSESPPPPRRRDKDSSSYPSHKSASISSEIWKLFGKDRRKYMEVDIDSEEDEAMEAELDDVMAEELRSARLAKREDAQALEDERRHEEDKRRRKLERAARERERSRESDY